MGHWSGWVTGRVMSRVGSGWVTGQGLIRWRDCLYLRRTLARPAFTGLLWERAVTECLRDAIKALIPDISEMSAVISNYDCSKYAQ